MNKLEAIEYLTEKGPRFSDEWTESGMYAMICEVVRSDEKNFDIEYLESLIDRASNF